LVEICSLLDASCYISGKGGRNYVDETLFQKSNIKLAYENFIHPKYSQLHGKFIENLSRKLLFFFSGASTAITGAAFVIFVIKAIMK